MNKQIVTQRPADFVDLGEYIPSLPIDLRYATEFNFTGRPVTGYTQPRCWLTKVAADAIKEAQNHLLPCGFSLLVFDAYRPQSAVNDFIQWAYESNDQSMKDRFYPGINKPDLVERGFIARQSTHSRGSTVDLTIADASILNASSSNRNQLEQCYGLDMGTCFDLFDDRSFTASTDISDVQQSNRKFLCEIMEQFGFKNLPMEWWHYTYNNEPYKETYFDFPL